MSLNVSPCAPPSPSVLLNVAAKPRWPATSAAPTRPDLVTQWQNQQTSKTALGRPANATGPCLSGGLWVSFSICSTLYVSVHEWQCMRAFQSPPCRTSCCSSFCSQWRKSIILFFRPKKTQNQLSRLFLLRWKTAMVWICIEFYRKSVETHSVKLQPMSTR